MRLFPKPNPGRRPVSYGKHLKILAELFTDYLPAACGPEKFKQPYGDYYGIEGKESPHRLILDILLDARRKCVYGQQDYYFDHPNTVGLIRRGDAEHPGSGLALLISDDGDKNMLVGEERKGEVWHEITGSFDHEITMGEDGRATFPVQGGKVAVWVKK